MPVISASFINEAPQRGSVPREDLVHRLCNTQASSASGPFAAAFLAAISFGLLPAILWPMRWAAFVDVERNVLLELISRWRGRVAPVDARKLDALAHRLRPRPILMVLPWLTAAFVGVLMVALLSQGDNPSRLSALTFHHTTHFRAPGGSSDSFFAAYADGDVWRPLDSYGAGRGDFRWEIESHLYQVWLVGLLAAYSLHWYAVRSHLRTVGSVVNWGNRLATSNGLPLVRNETCGSGLGFLWIVLGIVLCTANAWWGIPMVMAGAMQRSYSRGVSVRVRQALGCQLRDGSVAMMPESPMSVSRFCGSVHCGARLPAAANFCPRCGSAAVSARI